MKTTLNYRGYLFGDRQKVAKFKAENPEASVISLGIEMLRSPFHQQCKEPASSWDEMAQPEAFRGYGPEVGYDF